jgi:hypothetical protein
MVSAVMSRLAGIRLDGLIELKFMTRFQLVAGTTTAFPPASFVVSHGGEKTPVQPARWPAQIRSAP